MGKEMRPDEFWIHAPLIGRLAMMHRPRAGEWLDDDEYSRTQCCGNEIVQNARARLSRRKVAMQRAAMAKTTPFRGFI